MRKIILVVALVGLCFSAAFAQKQGKKSKEVAIPTAVRMISSTFADGLKDFYTGNYQGAEKRFRSVIERDAKHAAAYYMMGRIKRELRDFPAAEEFLRKACQADKNNVWYVKELAEILDLQGNYTASTKMWAQACKMQPDNEEFIICCADANMYNNNVKEVLKCFDKLEALTGPTNELTSAKVEMRLYINDIKGAIGVYDKLIKDFPNDPSNYVKAAEIYISNDMASKAIPYMEKAAALDANNGAVQLMLGNYYAAQGDSKAAYDAQLAAMRSQDVSLEQKLSILRSYMVNLNNQPTTQQIELTQALMDANPDAMEGWATMASIQFRQQKYDEAIVNFEKALEIDPAQYALWQDYLVCLARAKRYTKIIELEKDITEIFPTNSMVNHTLGSAYLNTGKPAQSIKYFEKAVKYTYDKTEQAHIYNAMSEAYEAMGDAEKAAEYRKKANKK